jgi:hypothetical protein
MHSTGERKDWRVEGDAFHLVVEELPETVGKEVGYIAVLQVQGHIC